jgi:hypothetical protein
LKILELERKKESRGSKHSLPQEDYDDYGDEEDGMEGDKGIKFDNAMSKVMRSYTKKSSGITVASEADNQRGKLGLLSALIKSASGSSTKSSGRDEISSPEYFRKDANNQPEINLKIKLVKKETTKVDDPYSGPRRALLLII